MDSEELQRFFGRQHRQHVWSTNDGDWGAAMNNHFYKYRYQLKHHGRAATSDTFTAFIPRILHFIWLGPRPMPTSLLQTWQEHHSDWEIRVWRNDNIPANLFNQDAFQYALQHELYGMASDILRCEVLYQCGGTYVDIDYVCVAPLTPFENLEFYAGASNVGCIEVNNGLLAARPQSPLIKLAMGDIHAWFEANERPLLLVSSFMGGRSTAACLLNDHDICRHTGPGLWTRILGKVFVQDEESLPETIMVFPYQVFHSMPNTDRGVEQSLEQVTERYAVPNTTQAIHLWYCSWQAVRNGEDEQVH